MTATTPWTPSPDVEDPTPTPITDKSHPDYVTPANAATPLEEEVGE